MRCVQKDTFLITDGPGLQLRVDYDPVLNLEEWRGDDGVSCLADGEERQRI